MVETVAFSGFWLGFVGIVGASTIWAIHAPSHGEGAFRYWGGNFAGISGLAWALSYLA